MPIDVATRPNRIPWPPLIYAACVVGAVAIGRLWPLDLGTDLRPVGIAIMLIGLGCDGTAMVTMRRFRANILPHRAATELVTTGPFAWSRNPIYLGNTLMLAGAAPTFGAAWFLVLSPVAVALVTVLAIRREERHLAARFGSVWAAYAARTPRWFGIHIKQ